MTAQRLALLSLGCALLAVPTYFVGVEVGDHIGYDASEETAIIGLATAGLLAHLLGVAAAIKASVEGSGGFVAAAAMLVGVGVVVLTLWVFTRLLAVAD
jgi:hypothetical protein